MNKKLLTIAIALVILAMVVAPVAAQLPAKSPLPSGKPFENIWTLLQDLQNQIKNIQLTPGPQGIQGPAGPAGATGATGSQGPAGPAGQDGAVIVRCNSQGPDSQGHPKESLEWNCNNEYCSCYLRCPPPMSLVMKCSGTGVCEYFPDTVGSKWTYYPIDTSYHSEWGLCGK